MKKLQKLTYLTFLLLVTSIGSRDSFAQVGKLLFEGNCKACHAVHQQVVIGPPLQDPVKKLSPDFFFTFLTKSDSLFMYDPYYKILKEKYGNMAHPSFSLSKSGCDSLFSYVTTSKHIISSVAGANDTSKLLDSLFFYFEADSIMTIGEDYTAVLNLSRSSTAFINLIKKAVNIRMQGTFVGVPNYIHAELQSDRFKIVQIGTFAFRDISKSEDLLWKWSLEPLKEDESATLYLTIYFSTKKDADLSNSEKIDNQKQYLIKIIARQLPTPSFLSKVEAFWKANWQWVMAVIVIPLITFAFNYWNERRKNKV